MRRPEPAAGHLRLATRATLGGLVALSAVATDIALPAQPVIAAALGGSATDAQWVVSSYLAGFAGGQILWGMASDHWGRLPAIRLGLAGFALVSIMLALAPRMDLFLLLRLVQGLTGGVGPVVARAIVRDLSGGAAGGRLMAGLTALLGLGPLLAPLAASAILLVLPWQALFWLSAGYALVLLVAARRTLWETRRGPGQGLGLAALGRGARRFLAIPACRTGLLLVALPFAGYLTVIAASSTVLEAVYGVPPTLFGAVFATAAIGFSGGSLIARRLLRHRNLAEVLSAGTALLALSALGLGAVMAGLLEGLVPFWGFVSLFIFGVGVLLPSATMLALEHVPEIAGLAAALIGTVQLAGGALVSALAAAAFDGTPRAMITVLLASAAAAILVRLAGRSDAA
ncbi:MAG: Bcr/CflA family drug resistance efflux transporter [Rhodothalassiaceae bacterium]|nr:MAG: Bcr/CflA family drug resistance efflux transporter [Rhodothalassiaceae bacterium]